MEGRFYSVTMINEMESLIYVKEVKPSKDSSYVYVYWLPIEDLNTGKKFTKWYTYKSWAENFIEVAMSPVMKELYGIE